MTDIAQLGYKVDSSHLVQGERALDRMTAAAERKAKASERLEAAWDKTKRAAAILGAAILVGATALGFMIKSTIDSMDQMTKLSQSVGMTTEELSALTYAGQLAGVSQDQLSTALIRLTKNASDAAHGVGDAKKGFDALGISVKGADGALKSNSQLLSEIAAKFAGYRDGAEKTALAVNLFGRSGAQLIPLLNSGADGLEKMTAEAEELGLVFDEKTGRAAEAFNDNLTRLNGVKRGLVARITAELLPSLVNLTDRFVGSAKSADRLDKVARIAATGMRLIGSAGLIVAGIFKTVGEALGGVAAAVVAVFQGRFADAWSITKDFSADIVGNIRGTVDSVAGMWDTTARDIEAESDATSDRIAAPMIKAADKSDKAAEKIAKAMDDMAKMQREWERDLAGTGNRIADGFEDRLGKIQDAVEKFSRIKVPAGEIQKFREEMTRLAEAIRDKDIADYLRDFNHETQEMTAFLVPGTEATLRHKQALYDLNREMAAGLIPLDAYIKRLGALEVQRDRASLSLLQAMRDEIELIGMSAREQEVWNNLKVAGVDAESAYGKAIIETTRLLQGYRDAMSDQIEAMDAVRGAGANLLSDLARGENPLSALESALDRVHNRLLDMISENLMDQLLGKQGDPGGGKFGNWLGGLFGDMFGVNEKGEAAQLSKAASELASSGAILSGSAASLMASASALAAAGMSAVAGNAGSSVAGGMSGGGGWASLIGAVIGGGKAWGGDVRRDRLYRVGEYDRPELLNLGRGQQYLIPGDSGRVEPMGTSSPATFGPVNQKIYVQGSVTKNSARQLAIKSEQRQRLATARLGG